MQIGDWEGRNCTPMKIRRRTDMDVLINRQYGRSSRNVLFMLYGC
jgi:hypothetical protein